MLARTSSSAAVSARTVVSACSSADRFSEAVVQAVAGALDAEPRSADVIVDLMQLTSITQLSAERILDLVVRVSTSRRVVIAVDSPEVRLELLLAGVDQVATLAHTVEDAHRSLGLLCSRDADA